MVMMAEKVCGNCRKSYSDHINGRVIGEVYCYEDTNGDLFTSNPTDCTLVEWLMEKGSYDALVEEWKKEHGHL